MQSEAAKRKNRMQAIRQSLQTNPILKTNTNAVQSKVEKRRKRRESVVFDETLTQSQKNMLLDEDDSSVKAMTKFHDKYNIGDKIGEGSDGLVKKCCLKSTNQMFAVKAMKMDEEHILFLKNNFKEIHALDHPNIVKYRTMYLDLCKKICYLVMDYETHPNLLNFNDLSEEEVKVITHQLLDTIAYIHSHNICHRDIKPQNILYNREEQQIKLIDFGISKNFQKRGCVKQMLTITGTLYYRAPEMFSGGGYDQKVDVWAAGVTLYQLITGKTPFQSEYLSTTIQNIVRGELCFEGEVWQRFGKSSKDLVSRLLRKKSERMTAVQGKKHFWFNKRPSMPIDLTKSDSLNFKIGEFASISSQKYAEDTDQSRTTQKIPHLSLKLGKFVKEESSSDSDDLIEIQSQGEGELDSPCHKLKIPPILEQQLFLKPQGSSVEST